MKIVDHRHIQFDLELGDLIITEGDSTLMFIGDEGNEKYPYLLVSLSTFEIVNKYPKNDFYNFKIGYLIPYVGVIKEIHKNKNLTLSYR
jgi:hypothetical protein